MTRPRFSQKARESVLGGLVDTHITDNTTQLNALEFIESSGGLNISLYPVQRVLIKLIFGIPMDWNEKEVPVYDQFCEKLLFTFTEREYIRYVFEKGRINIPTWEDANPLGYNEIDMIVGRRGGKSVVVAAVAAYKLYLLLSHRDPQEYYGLVPGSPIDLTMMAQDSKGSSRLYDQLKEDINRAPFFAPYIKSMTGEEMTFVSEADRGKRELTPSIKAAAYPCTTNAVRGPSSYFLALDEFAHYRQQIGSSSDEMYSAAAPATMQFKGGGTREGLRESMIFIITSPVNKIGKYYTLFKTAMEEGAASPVLAFQCSTAEMNPRSDTPFLKKEYKDNPEKFRAEYGGEFLDSSETYVRALTISDCVEQDRGNATHLVTSMIGHNYFWGLDLGMRHDATALAVCHWEGGMNQAWLKFDFIGRLMVGEGEYKDFSELPLDDVLAWLKMVHQMMPCFQGATDQYGGSLLVQLLAAHEINGIELVHLTTGVNSQMYLTLKTLMENRQAKFPNVEKFILEMKLLEATFINKYQVRVAAPTEKDAHDDMADATALAAYKAQLWAVGDGKRVMWDIMQGVPQNIVPGTIAGGWDMNSSLAHLRSYERQLAHQFNPSGAILNPYRRH